MSIKIPAFVYRFIHKPWKRSLRFFFQRITRGYDDSETWNLDCRLAEYILPRLKRFRQINPCYPTDTPEEWDQILDQMIFAFEWYASDVCERDNINDETYQKVQRGMALFAEYYGALWW
jgi:hypothetical protein